MAGIDPDRTGNREAGFDRGRAATEKALAELEAARTVSPEARLTKAKLEIRRSLVKLIIGVVVGAGLGWLYWTTESRWAFFGAAVLGLGPVLGALRGLYRGIGEYKAVHTGE
jgi:F0F1-type ATP synthase assembly protein I